MLYEVAEQACHITKILVASDDPDDTAPRTGPVFDRSFADLLDEVAAAVAAYRKPDTDPATPRAALDRARHRRAALARQTPWPEHLPPEDWSAHAALLLAAEHALLALVDS